MTSERGPGTSGRRSPGRRAGGLRGAVGAIGSAAGFSLMELLLSIAIMTVIVGALYGLFHHTQRALRANVTQVDVLEAGRSAMGLLSRDLVQMARSGLARETNLLVALSPVLVLPQSPARQRAMYYVTNPPPNLGQYQPVVQKLMAGGETRTNLLHEVYFIQRQGDRVTGISYRVLNVTNGVGLLGRYGFDIHRRQMAHGLLSSNVIGALASQYAPLADGVIHFQLRLYDHDGLELDWETAWRFTNQVRYPGVYLGTNLFLARDRVPTETAAMFLTNALPAYVEVELGVLEPKTYQQYRAFGDNQAMASRYLANRAAQVQLFRQRVPIPQAPFIQAALP